MSLPIGLHVSLPYKEWPLLTVYQGLVYIGSQTFPSTVPYLLSYLLSGNLEKKTCSRIKSAVSIQIFIKLDNSMNAKTLKWQFLYGTSYTFRFHYLEYSYAVLWKMCLFSYLHLEMTFHSVLMPAAVQKALYNLAVLWQYSGRCCMLLISKKWERLKIAAFCDLKFKWGAYSCSMNHIIIYNWYVLCLPDFFLVFFYHLCRILE